MLQIILKETNLKITRDFPPVNVPILFSGPSETCQKRLWTSSCLSVCPSTRNNSDSTKRFFMKCDAGVFFENPSRKFDFHKNYKIITITLHEDQCTLMIVPRLILLQMRNLSDKSCRKNKKKNILR